MPAPVNPRKLSPALGIIWGLIHSFMQASAVSPAADPTHSMAAAERWRVAGGSSLGVVYSGSAVPSKGTGTNLDPEQGPQTMLSEPMSSLCCPDGPSASTAPRMPFLNSSTPGHSLPWFALHPYPGHLSIPHTPRRSPQVAEEDAGPLPHQDPPIKNEK